MKILNLLISLLAISMFTYNSHAQQQKYYKISVGYNLGTSRQIITYNIDSASSHFIFDPVKKSFGQGFSILVSNGKVLNESLSLEFDVGMVIGNSFQFKQDFITNIYETKISGLKLFFIPNLYISANNKKINPYFKIGPVISTCALYSSENFTYNNTQYDVKKTLKGGISVGLNNSIGILISKNERTQFYVEINLHQLTYFPKKGEVTSAKVDNQDITNHLYINDKKIEYLSVYDEKNDVVYNPSKPRKELGNLYPFGHTGLNLGIRLNY